MGYYTRFDGEITLSSEPSIEIWDHITQLDSFYFLEDTPPELYISFEDLEGKFYNLTNDASTLVCILEQVGISATGTVVGIGEEQPDIWRLVFKDGSVIKEYTKTVWPDGTEYH